jgi:hypothetical protein
MTADELEFYLQSGNLPEWAYQGTTASRRRRVGRGVLQITHGGKKTGARSARAAVVKRVMAERGVSLPQASKIVKEEGLY